MNFSMKWKWILLSLVMGLLFFMLGCMAKADPIQYFGTVVLIPGLLGLLYKIWPEGEKA